MRSRTIRGAIAGLLCGVAVAWPPVLSQESLPETGAPPEADSDQIYFERVAVDIVNVEVYVSDAEGNPVLGLTADDFEVTEDERPVEIVNFFSVADGRPQGAGSGDEPGETLPPEASRRSLPRMATGEGAMPESQRLHLVVYVDNFNIHPLNRNRAFWRLRTFLSDTLEPGDRAMVASYDRSLQIRQPFTESAETLNRVLLELEEVSAMGNEKEAERAATSDQSERSTCCLPRRPRALRCSGVDSIAARRAPVSDATSSGVNHQAPGPT